MRSSGSTKEHLDHIHLERRHHHNQARFRQREPKDPVVCRDHRRIAAVLARPEVLLQPVDPCQPAAQAEDRLVHGFCFCLGSCSTIFFALDGSLLVLELDLKIDKFFGKGRHVVRETKRVLAHFVGRKDEVALTLFLQVEKLALAGALDLDINVKRASRLDLFFFPAGKDRGLVEVNLISDDQ